jgi:hypothetical protein
MVSTLLRGEGTLRRRSGRGVAIGLELDAIPLHDSMETRLILRMAYSGEDKGGVGAASRRLSTGTELLICRVAA